MPITLEHLVATQRQTKIAELAAAFTERYDSIIPHLQASSLTWQVHTRDEIPGYFQITFRKKDFELTVRLTSTGGVAKKNGEACSVEELSQYLVEEIEDSRVRGQKALQSLACGLLVIGSIFAASTWQGPSWVLAVSSVITVLGTVRFLWLVVRVVAH